MKPLSQINKGNKKEIQREIEQRNKILNDILKTLKPKQLLKEMAQKNIFQLKKLTDGENGRLKI